MMVDAEKVAAALGQHVPIPFFFGGHQTTNRDGRVLIIRPQAHDGSGDWHVRCECIGQPLSRVSLDKTQHEFSCSCATPAPLGCAEPGCEQNPPIHGRQPCACGSRSGGGGMRRLICFSGLLRNGAGDQVMAAAHRFEAWKQEKSEGRER